MKLRLDYGKLLLVLLLKSHYVVISQACMFVCCSKSHSKTFVENTNDLLDRMKLLTTDGSDNSTGKSAQRMKSNFESEMKKLNPKIQAIADNFKKVLDEKIKKTLTKSLHNGVKKGSAEAMNTVHSWGSSNRRTAHERRPDKNGM